MTSQDFYMDLLSEGNKSSQQSAQTSTPAYAHSTSDSDTASRVEALIAELRASGRDITADYGDWLKVGFALASEFGEAGRSYFHDISSLYSGYSREESDTKYSECLKSDNGRTDISTLFYLAKNQGVTLRRASVGPQPNNASPSTKGQSDKNVPLTLSLDDPEEMPTLPMFPEDIFSTLPGLLRKVTDLMLTHQERSLVLIGSIATLSSALLPMYTIYFGKTIYPNMYLFVPGPAGAGKGKLDFCFRLVKPIHKEKLERWTIAKDEYKKEYARYKRQKKGDNIDPPEKPPIQLLRVPANSSATSFAQAMAENGNLILFETEGDTVVNTFNSDFGNYSDSFRKAFAHESFGYLRRGDDGEEREIENPRLSTVLSGTPEQAKSLIHDAEMDSSPALCSFASTPHQSGWMGSIHMVVMTLWRIHLMQSGRNSRLSRRFLSRLHVSNSLYPFHRQASSTISLRQKKSECMSSMGTVTLPAHIAWPGASSV